MRPVLHAMPGCAWLTVTTSETCGCRLASSSISSRKATSCSLLAETINVTRRHGSDATAWRIMLTSGVMPTPPARNT
jgi:hypothetical protein